MTPLSVEDTMSLVTGRQDRDDKYLGGRCPVCRRRVGSYFVLGGVGGTFLLHTHVVRGAICKGSHRPRAGAKALNIV